MPVMTITVEGMSCGGCEKSVENALKRLEGVKDAKADRVGKKVDIQFEGAAPAPQTIRQAVAAAGYTAVI